jgi:hypothetical protein
MTGAMSGGPVTVSVADFMWFVDRAMDSMVAILRQLGDERANQRPALEGANSPFAILAHCMGVMEFWAGFMVAGRAIQRDRAAEFEARGKVEDLAQRARTARGQLADDIARLDSASVPPDVLGPEDAGRPYGASHGAVLVHILEELFQHLGQMEVTRDVLLAAG